jgi:hypothetical protein
MSYAPKVRYGVISLRFVLDPFLESNPLQWRLSQFYFAEVCNWGEGLRSALDVDRRERQ